MNIPSPIRVGAVLFEGFELLDFYGPLEMFGLLEGEAGITVVAEKAGAVKSAAGPSGMADATMAGCPGFDVLLIPGGIGTRKKMADPQFLSELKRLAKASRIVATVCTGSLVLAKTGLIDGRKATTNKRVFQFVKTNAPKVNWIAKARWVEDSKYFTSSGVSAGMDMALAVIAKSFGREKSLEIASRAEYEWHEDSSWDPFAAAAGGL
ncbi:MAG TPA: DJ-1/PfpI family protein [Candidatus Limnocylindrales bacterium]|nr:DJ-1/PfpI family protein [Candidatus Limnocylindrales bacterium]